MSGRVVGAVASGIAISALLGAAPPSVFTDPIPIAETTVAAPPAAAEAGNRIHLFWLDRPPGSPAATGELWHAALTSDGRLTIHPRRLHAGADVRFAWPVAVRSATGLVLAWMAREGDRVAVRLTLLSEEGEVRRVLSPASGIADEGGRLALFAGGEPERIHLAWSQFDRGARRIWYARLTADGLVEETPRALIEGEGAALGGGPRLRLFWWRAAGAGTFTLNAAELDGELHDPLPLTGPILLVSALPPIPLRAPGGGLDLLVPTTERAFRTSGQLYLIRVRGGEVSARLPLSRGRPLSDVAAVTGEGGSILVWSEGAGRRQNNEIFSARFDSPTGQLVDVSRVTYTVPGSIRPAIADGRVVWLETRDITRFQIMTAGASAGRGRLFLLGVPELDAARPGRALLFAGTAAVGVLPLAALFAAVFGLAALALGLLGGLVLGEFPWWEELRRRQPLRLGGFLAAVLALEVAARTMIPGQPGVALLAGALAVPGAAALGLLSRVGRASGIAVLAGASAVLLLQMIAVLFPWAAGQLSQL